MNSLLKEQGYLLVKHVLTPDIYKFLTHVLLRKQHLENIEDPQVPDCLAIMSHEVMFETVLEQVWPLLEQVVELELLPTYAYARLYTNGNMLENHTDRPACEISLTVQLARSHHYSWPIYLNGTRFDLAEGDGIIYLGCDMPHWREVCMGPPDYYTGQVFLHYVNANGPYSSEYGDITSRKPADKLFAKYRNFLVEDK